MALPSQLIHTALPDKSGTVQQLMNQTIPPYILTARFARAEKYLSSLAPNEENLHEIISLLSPPHTVLRVLLQSVNKPNINSIQCPHSPIAGGKRYPLWVVTYWAELMSARDIQKIWRTVLSDVAEGQVSDIHHDSPDPHLLHEARNAALHTILWSAKMDAFQTKMNTHQLSAFFTREWLSDEHEDLMIELLQEDLKKNGVMGIILELTSFVPLLLRAHADQEHYMDEQCYQWLRKKGEDGSKYQKTYATIVNKDGNHWVASVIDFQNNVIGYGDSMAKPMSKELKNALEWWTLCHTAKKFHHKTLSAPFQDTSIDSYSCGIFAWNILGSYLLPSCYSIMNPAHVAEERLKIFLRLIKTSNSNCVEENKLPLGLDHSIRHPHTVSNDIQPLSISAPVKRSYHEHIDNVPSFNPIKKKRMESVSAIRLAIQSNETQKPRGLLQYFKPSTKQEHEELLARTKEEVQNNQAANMWKKELITQKKLALKRVKALERKRKERTRQYQSDIKEGLRSPGGTKHTHNINLKDVPLAHDGFAVAELSRPARALKVKIRNKTRKPQGPKAKKPIRSAKYHNWFEPFLFRQIELARKTAGGPNMSTRNIVKELKKRDYNTFKGLNRTTMDGWIDRRPGLTPQWKHSVLIRIEKGSDPGHTKGGRKGILAKHPEIVESITERLISLRNNGAPLTIVTIRAIIIATITHVKPEILQKRFRDGSTFRASESFIRKWLHSTLSWSRRKGTQAAQKLPKNWEELCEKSAFRKAHIIKENDIPDYLHVNSDQTQVKFAPGDNMTWTETGIKQVQIYGGEDKRAFTAMVSISNSGVLLPIQAIYSGKTSRSRPSAYSPHYWDLIKAGFLLEASGTTTYWSNHETMQSFVNKILVPYFNSAKAENGLPESQPSLWTIDVWSVHRSKLFIDWMRKHHPTIILDFVPGGCTGVAQPCDVGIQRAFKLSIKKSYHEDIVAEVLNQLDSNTTSTPVVIDSHIGTMRDRSTRWLWNAFNESLVKKAFELCVVREWNLSYGCLTGVAMRTRLRELKVSDPEFWKELTTRSSEELVPAEDEIQPEDESPLISEGNGPTDHDCDIPMAAVIDTIINGSIHDMFSVSDEGGMVSVANAEDANHESDGDEEEQEVVVLGRGKRHKIANKLYNSERFWRHDDEKSDGEF